MYFLLLDIVFFLTRFCTCLNVFAAEIRILTDEIHRNKVEFELHFELLETKAAGVLFFLVAVS